MHQASPNTARVLFKILNICGLFDEWGKSESILRNRRISWNRGIDSHRALPIPTQNVEAGRVGVSPLPHFDFTLSTVEPRSKIMFLSTSCQGREVDDKFRITKYIMRGYSSPEARFWGDFKGVIKKKVNIFTISFLLIFEKYTNV